MDSSKMEFYMKDALKEAQKAFDMGEVPCGCVFVLNDEIIARGCNYVNNTKNATKHAEFLCIDNIFKYCKDNKLKESDIFSEISVVVTVEPCIMCSAALHMVGVKEIIYGCVNDRFGGKTVVDVSKVVNKNIPIQSGICAEKSMDLLRDFYKQENPSAPVAKTRR